jgi:ribA/ribD-fused uncharacterized protein
MNEDVIFFWGGHLSQWASSNFIYRGIKFNTAEQFMMYHKAKVMGDNETASLILKTPHPRHQKQLGRIVKNFDPILWDRVKQDIVYLGNLLKFTQDKNLKEYILGTGDKLIVEASPEDSIWGIGLSEYDAKKTPRPEWPGKNLLGITLMEVRNDIRKGNF